MTAANCRTLDFTDAQSNRFTVLKADEKQKELADISVRFEGLHLPNAHFLVDGYPIPAHVVTIALYLFHNWKPLAAVGLLLFLLLLLLLASTSNHLLCIAFCV